MDIEQRRFFSLFLLHPVITVIIQGETDPRLKILKKPLFEKKKALDIGCNVGKLTIDMGTIYSN
jgi:hypothetical protein